VRYRLRTLLILLAVGPPLMAAGWNWYVEYRSARELAALEAAIAGYKRGRNYAPSQMVSPLS
jgi:hypothetical protein